MRNKGLKLLVTVLLILAVAFPYKITAKAVSVVPFTSPIDYSISDNWLYDGAYPENAVDVFIVAPTVDTISDSNSTITPKFKTIFRNAMNQQQAIFAPTARVYAPYYRQASIKVYAMTDPVAKEQAMKNAYMDVSAAFKYYLEHKNNGRPIILAGFSQGADMCYRLLEEYYGGNGERAVKLRDNLIAVYAIGWTMTEEMITKYPQIVPATGETDTGVVVSYDCEDGKVTDSFITPAGTKAISINPLNWRTDSVVASKSLNKGTVTQDSKTGAILSMEKGKFGAYIDPDRGTLVVTDVDTSQYPKVLDIFPDGSLHLYDNFFFFVNLQENVQKRTESFLQKKLASDAA
ncbi:DUF3089 domain-containing protein [Butyrivibrio sp. CB08]|uniref:DUF3089 domain-containing protein n=1 Tax=Butyrivibrio sp. CB08 TaxID=2364879 RepID=UPI000EA8BC87|nr:DUF3089 domain-containing protein [Butyrivibrio sp. CB08]RKM59386.1 DUF3089 domain-containing protein [Butyrivibrio sp. CB08]